MMDMSASKDENKNTVVLAIDHSNHAHDTVNYYMKKIHKPGNKIILTYVIEIPENAFQAMQAMMSRDKIQEIWNTEEDKAKQLETEYVEELQKQGVNQEDIAIKNKAGMKPGHVICHVGDEENASLIVIGSRGAGKIRRTILGSVSDHVLHHAHCPVLVCNYGKDDDHHHSTGTKERHPSGKGRERQRHLSGQKRQETPSVFVD